MVKNVKKQYLKKFKQEAERETRSGGGTEVSPRLKPETKSGIFIILIFTVAIVTLFSLFGWAGQFGQAVNVGLTYSFGWGKFVIPLVLAVLGYLLTRPRKYEFRLANGVGLVLFLLSGTGFLHLVAVPLERAVIDISEGRGGGYLGLLLSYPLNNIMGPWLAGIILVAATIISLLIFYDVSLSRLYQKGNILKSLTGRIKQFFYKIKVNMESTGGDTVDDQELEEPEDAGTDQFQVKSIDSQAEISKTTEAEPEHKAEDKEQTALFNKKKKRANKIEIPIDLLESSSLKATSGDIDSSKEIIQKTFSNFGIEVAMGETKVGPTVTQYTLRPEEGVKISQITNLDNDLALALAAHPIRIEAPIPGKSLVGIEVPNQAVALVKLKEIIQDKEFKKSKSNLTIGLGKDVAGKIWAEDLDPMPHLLIAGATGSGKSVCLNIILLSLLYQNSPDQLKLILIDPKRVELSVYNGIPHLITPVVNDVDKTINALRWVVSEMDRRFELLSKTGHRDIRSYNNDNGDTMPYLVVAIDELADLMTVAANEVEAAIVRLAQMARAVGIHLILATQRPSVDIITGLIKANITTRIAFAVASKVDSRTILDTSGADKLLGRGDLLYITPQLSKPKRLQGAYVTDQEISRVTSYLKSKGQPEYQEEITAKVVDRTLVGNFEDMGDDELVDQAKDLVLKAGKASASLLQRRLRVGYARAARLLDILEEQGVIGPGDGAKPRVILQSQPDRPYEAGGDLEDDNFANDESSEIDESSEEEVDNEDEEQVG